MRHDFACWLDECVHSSGWHVVETFVYHLISISIPGGVYRYKHTHSISYGSHAARFRFARLVHNATMTAQHNQIFKHRLGKCVFGIVPTIPLRNTMCMQLILHTTLSPCMRSHVIVPMCACTFVLQGLYKFDTGAVSKVGHYGLVGSQCLHTHQDLKPQTVTRPHDCQSCNQTLLKPTSQHILNVKASS